MEAEKRRGGAIVSWGSIKRLDVAQGMIIGIFEMGHANDFGRGGRRNF